MTIDWARARWAILLLFGAACRLDEESPTEPPGMAPQPTIASVAVVDTLEPNADAHIRAFMPNTNYGSADSLTIRTFTTNSNVFAAYIKFDLAAIQAQVGSGQLDSAKLELMRRGAGSWPAAGDYINVWRIPASWAPGGWAEPNITFNCPHDTNPANNGLNCPGGVWDTTGFGALAPTDQVLMKNSTTGWASWDVTADIEAWIAGTANHGWYIAKHNPNTNARIVFWSREGTYKPHLILYVSDDSDVWSSPRSVDG